jgi:hypothetical protein
MRFLRGLFKIDETLGRFQRNTPYKGVPWMKLVCLAMLLAAPIFAAGRWDPEWVRMRNHWHQLKMEMHRQAFQARSEARRERMEWEHDIRRAKSETARELRRAREETRRSLRNW